MICESATAPPSAVSQYLCIASPHSHQWPLLAQLERLDLTLLRECRDRDFRKGLEPEPSSNFCRLRKVKELCGSEMILTRKSKWRCGELFFKELSCTLFWVVISSQRKTASEVGVEVLPDLDVCGTWFRQNDGTSCEFVPLVVFVVTSYYSG